MPITERNGQLHIKSYYASSVPDAMEQARQQLGPEALLLNSREAPAEVRHLGEYEVVFGTRAEAMPQPPGTEELAGITDLYRQIAELRNLVTRNASSGMVSRRFVAGAALIEAGIEPALAQELDEAIEHRIRKRSVLAFARPRTGEEPAPLSPAEEVAEELAMRLEISPQLERITAIVGPPGSGKTTAIVKLAITQGLLQGRAVKIYSADCHRIGAADQLRTYAGIMGVPFEAVEGSAALARGLDAAPDGALILIDTAGYGTRLLREVGSDIAGFLFRRQDIDTHLALTASMNPADMRRIAADFEVFGYSKLLLTKADEANSFAAAICEIVRRKRPLSFVCDGQSIPEDIQAGSKDYLIASVVRRLPESFRAAA